MPIIDVFALICILIFDISCLIVQGYDKRFNITATRGVGDRRQAVEEGVLIGIPWPIGQRLYVHLAEIN